MESVTEFFKSVLSQFSGANFALLVIIDFSAFGAVCLAAVLGCLFLNKLRARDKRVFLCIVNAFTAVTLAVFLSEFSLGQSVAVSAVFWCVGYLVYGVLCLFKVKGAEKRDDRIATVSVMPTAQMRPPKPAQSPVQTSPAAAVNTGVRLEHALSIADKLLLKNLGRGDRQELEKIKTALTVLKVKGVLSPQEGEALNDMFNALLKLMAKYDL